MIHGSRNPQKRLPHLAYSDDVVLCNNTTADAQEQLNRFEEVATSLGMSLNLGSGKTEEIRLNAPPSDLKLRVASGKEVGIVESYKYLGTTLGTSWSTDFDRRKSLAWANIRKFRHVWASRADMDSKQQLFQAIVEPALSYSAFTYPDTDEVTYTLHSTHSRMLRHCLGLPRANTSRGDHRPTEWLYFGRSKELGKTLKSAILTLPATVMRQRLSALGHWVRDHYYRGVLQDDPLRRHPVIDVLRFDPSDCYRQRSQGTVSTLRNSYQSAVRYAGDPSPSSDLLKSSVLVSKGSRCANKDQWYNESKRRVQEFDSEILQTVLDRRLRNAERSFNKTEYDRVMIKLRDNSLFTKRWLTRKTRSEPLGEDKDLCVPRRRRYID